LADVTGERCYEAELYRLKGELMLSRTRTNASVRAAESCFEQALATARQQEARSLELRAALSLARLYRDDGRHVMAHDLLIPIYERFDEGFDTADLREARDLLNVHAER
jgi:adenylate cyclase